MKNKTKKILAGLVMGVAGMGLLTGCSMTDEQMAALNTLTQNTETLVESFDKYLDASNSKLDKDVAFDMLKQARLKATYITDDSELCQINIDMVDELNPEAAMGFSGVYDFSTDIKKCLTLDAEGNVQSVIKCDMTDATPSYGANIVSGQPTDLGTLSESWYNVNIRMNIDPLAQAGISNITIDDVTNVSVENGEYKFTVLKTEMRTFDEKYIKVTNFCTIVVKDYLFKSVYVEQIQEEGTELSFQYGIDGEKIDDGYGSYLFSGSVVGYIKLSADYTYGADVDLTTMNTVIADIDAKLAAGELTISAE